MQTRLLSTLVVLLFFVTSCAARRAEVERQAQPSRLSLTEHPIVGALGVPLGTVVEVRASVVAGSELRKLRYEGMYLLRVTEVDHRPLVPSPPMEFSVRFGRVKLANDDFALYELKTGTKPSRLDSKQIHDLQKDYVGKEVRLVVYETGSYSGIPSNLPKDVPVWQDHSFGFSTSLIVLAERSE